MARMTMIQALRSAMDVMLEANVELQLRTLTPGDVRVDVHLGDIGTADFERVPDTIPLGEKAAREQAAAIERRLKERYGDRVIRVKKSHVLTPDHRRARVYQDGLTSMSNTEITKKHGISRATLYRWMKTTPK